MRVFDNGSSFTVQCSQSDVDSFNSRWPCSVIDRPMTFAFDKRNGDLVDVTPSDIHGSEVVALSEDAQKYGESRLKALGKWSVPCNHYGKYRQIASEETEHGTLITFQCECGHTTRGYNEAKTPPQ